MLALSTKQRPRRASFLASIRGPLDERVGIENYSDSKQAAISDSIVYAARVLCGRLTVEKITRFPRSHVSNENKHPSAISRFVFKFILAPSVGRKRSVSRGS